MRNKILVLLMFCVCLVGCQKESAMVCKYDDGNLETTYTINSKKDVISKVKISNIYDMNKIGYEDQGMNELFSDTSDRIMQKGLNYSSKIKDGFGEEVIEINLEKADLDKVENSALLYSPLEKDFELEKLISLLTSNNYKCNESK